jgi:hypothetical protein
MSVLLLADGRWVFRPKRKQAERLLRVLPLVYDRGVFRVGRDAFPSGRTPRMPLFPTVGFRRADDATSAVPRF